MGISCPKCGSPFDGIKRRGDLCFMCYAKLREEWREEWRCAAGHCHGKSHIPNKDLRRVYRCGGCKKLYHAGCSGGHPGTKCDECWAKGAK